MKQIAISFIIPIYNVETYIVRCIESILSLQKITFEVILINDGSSDGSGFICDQYLSKDKRILVIHQENKGLGPSRNRGLSIAKGKYIAFIDGDDWIDADKFLELYYCAKTHNAEMVMGDFRYCYENDITKKSYIHLQDEICGLSLFGESLFNIYEQGNSFVPMVCLYIFSKAFLDRTQLQFDNIIHEDELWTTKVLCLSRSVVFSRVCFYNYYQRENSIMSSSSSEKRIQSLFYIAHCLLVFVREELLSKRDDLVYIGFVLLRVSELYRIAFQLLSKIKDSSVSVPKHHLFSLFYNRGYLSGNMRKRYIKNYCTSRSLLRQYNNWKNSVWVTDVKEKRRAKSKLILVYNLMWKSSLDIPINLIPDGYIFTTDRKYLIEADLVVFHLPTLKECLDIDLEKPEHQIWVGWSLECEDNYRFMKDEEFMEVFDYMMTYHKSADVVFPYYKSNYASIFHKCRDDEKRTKDICMLISSPFNLSKRQEYLKELMEYISIDSYGRLFNNAKLEMDNGRESKLDLYKEYKFVIAFENNCAPDYVTEKFYDPLLSGAVPIYLGADNIDEFIPGNNCYIDVRKYPEPKDLAEYLQSCITNGEEYNKLQRWRKEPIIDSFKELLEEQRINPFIRLCALT